MKKIYLVALVLTLLLLTGCASKQQNVAGSYIPVNITVPNVIGMTSAEAEKVLTTNGFKVTTVYDNSDKAKDTVLLTDPLPGVKVASGSTIKLTLSSGEKKEKSLTVTITLPESSGNVKVSAYVDGTYLSSKTVDTEVVNKTSFKIKGTTGIKEVKIKLNDIDYKSYELNFDKDTVTEK